MGRKEQRGEEEENTMAREEKAVVETDGAVKKKKKKKKKSKSEMKERKEREMGTEHEESHQRVDGGESTGAHTNGAELQNHSKSASKFAKALAGSSDDLRQSAIESLKLWILARARAAGAGIRREAVPGARRREDTSGRDLDAGALDTFRADLCKVHRGCFYTLWHSDGRKVQHKLSKSLSGLIKTLGKYAITVAAGDGSGTVCMDANIGFEYCRSMMLVLRREWFGIDRLRLDKFMLFARMMVLDSLRAAASIDNGVALFSSVIRYCVIGVEKNEDDMTRKKKKSKKGNRHRRNHAEGGDEDMDLDLNLLNDAAGSVGLTMHVASVLVPCLAVMKKNFMGGKLGDSAEDVTASPSLFEIMLPFIEALGSADVSAAAFNRILENVLEPIIGNVEGAILKVEQKNSRVLSRGATSDDGGSSDGGPDLEAMLLLEKAELRRASDILILIAGSANTREEGRGELYDLQMRYEAACVAVENMAMPLSTVFPDPDASVVPKNIPNAASRGDGGSAGNCVVPPPTGENGKHSNGSRVSKEKREKREKKVKIKKRDSGVDSRVDDRNGSIEHQGGSKKRKAAAMKVVQPTAAAQPMRVDASYESPAKKRVRFALKRNMTKVFDKTKNEYRPPPPPSPKRLTPIIKTKTKQR